MEYRPKDSHLEFLKELRNMNIDLGAEDLELLRKHNAISDEQLEVEKSRIEARKVATAAELDRYVLTMDAYLSRCEMLFGTKWQGRSIKKTDWACESPSEFTDDFKKFINSHFVRFCDLMAYEPFYLYIKQAYDWLSEPLPELSQLDEYEKMRFWKREDKRIRRNTLYALDRYGYVKESAIGDGSEDMKYKANLAHAFILYLFDDGRSVFAGKGRQMAFTTTLAAAAVIRMNYRENTHVKLIACDLETTEEIYEDKVKYAFDRLPWWAKCKVRNRSGKLLRVSTDTTTSKTDFSGYSSKVSIVAPKITAINGGAPHVVLIDEAAFLDIFSEMVEEARPTIWISVNGRLQQRRQVWAWSTGGRSESGKGSYEREHRDLFTKWVSGDFSNGVIPVFLDWTCRPGASVEWYLREKQAYMVKDIEGHSDATVEQKLIVFRQHNPSSIDDMYAISRNTLVSPTIIIKNEDKILALPTTKRPTPGRFNIIPDKDKPLPADSFMKYAPLAVQWIPGNDPFKDPVQLFMPPVKGWRFRTYQGTDPIDHDEGFSKHASTIYDAYYRAPVCQVNMRGRDPYESYLQSIAMGMYYANHGEKFCPELVENNIGKLYIKYKSGHEWNGGSSLVMNKFLPDYLQGGEDIGFDSKAGRKAQVVLIGAQFTQQHGDNIYFPAYWKQLRTFTPTTSKQGKTTWAVDDRRKNQDDVLDSTWYSYICRMAHQMWLPMSIQQFEKMERESEPEFMTILDGRGNPRRVHVNDRIARQWLKEQED